MKINPSYTYRAQLPGKGLLDTAFSLDYVAPNYLDLAKPYTQALRFIITHFPSVARQTKIITGQTIK
jgi:hypothetical protein